jgi:hypothetical protein
MGGLLLCLRVTTVSPALVTSDNPGQEVCIVRGSLMKLLADVDMLLLLISCQNPGRNHISPDTQLQIKGRNKSAHPPCCMKFCTLTPKICYITIYHCIVLLQLLYRWQYQSQKLWIPPCIALRLHQIFTPTLYCDITT